jgi:hypothetical protein
LQRLWITTEFSKSPKYYLTLIPRCGILEIKTREDQKMLSPEYAKLQREIKRDLAQHDLFIKLMTKHCDPCRRSKCGGCLIAVRLNTMANEMKAKDADLADLNMED